jgi:hypothetical protein
MTVQPLCRVCGKKIAKKTEAIWFNGDPNPPRTLDEAKARTNLQITSHTWFDRQYGSFVGRHIDSIRVWDGESYVDPYFCNGTCAKLMAYAAAESGMVTSNYKTAKAKAEVK